MTVKKSDASKAGRVLRKSGSTVRSIAASELVQVRKTVVSKRSHQYIREAAIRLGPALERLAKK